MLDPLRLRSGGSEAEEAEEAEEGRGLGSVVVVMVVAMYELLLSGMAAGRRERGSPVGVVKGVRVREWYECSMPGRDRRQRAAAHGT
jgi:hypothetical protein